jgi:hypothetical protein
MTRLIQLPPEVEEIAAAQAQKNGISMEEYLPELITNALTQQLPSIKQDSEGQEMDAEHRAARIQRFRRWAESNGHDTPRLSDEEISREAMYAEG